MSRERPKRNIIQKKFDDNDGIPWSEERVVRRVLYLSLKEFKTAQKTKVENSTGIINGTFAKRRLSGSGAKAALFSGSCKSERTQQAVQSKRRSHEFSIDGPSRKRPRLQAQRKFAQSHPCSPSATPLKVLEGRSPSPAALLTRRKPKTEDFLTFLCLRGSPALPSNMVYFGSAKGDEDVEEEEEEEEEEDNASDPSASCQSTPRKSKGANKCIANGHVFNGQTRPAEEPESRLRLRGKEPVLQRKERHSSSSARSSSTHNLRPNRTLQEQKSQASRMNGSSGSSTVSSRKTTEVQTPPTKAVKYPKGHVTYTKARLLKEAKLSLSTHTHTPPRHPHSQNSGKAQTSHAKMQKQVLPSAAAGRLYGTSVLPPRRNGLRQSKRQLELAGLSQTAAEVQVKRAKGQAVPLEARRRRAAQEVLARQQMPGSQRPKRASAGKLMFTKQMQCKAKNSPTTSTRDPPRSANLPKTSERKSSAPKQSSAPPRTELLSAEPKERGRRSAEITEVPVFYPTTHEFHDPLSFVELVRGQSEAFGLFRVVPPAGWSPECKLKEEMRFVSYVQHVHKLGRRWGPNVQRLACIRRHLRAQGLNLDEPPLIGGCELDLARFSRLIGEMGGMQQVTDLKSWGRLADMLGIPRSAQDRLAKLQEAYCQYLLSYDSLPSAQRTQLERDVLAEKEVLERRSGPLEGQGDIAQHAALQLPRCEPKNGLVNGALHRSGAREHLRELDPTAKSTRQRRLEKKGEEEELIGEQHKCINRGKSFSLTTFFRAARNTMNMCFSKEPDTAEVEKEYWRLVEEKQCHVAVHCGRVDTKTHGSGFPVCKSEPFSKHGWNLNVLSNNSGSILRHLGAVPGVTIPWLNIGMVFSTSCWCRDQNSLPYIDYLHTGADCIWYCIPAEEKWKLDKVVHTLLQANGTPGLEMLEKNIMISPEVLRRKGVKVYRTVQHSGQFMVCFPGTFVSKVCCGYSVSETVHFANLQWIKLGFEAAKDLKRRRIEEPFSTEKLLYQITSCEQENKPLMSAAASLLRDLRDAELGQRKDLFQAGLRLSARYGSNCESHTEKRKQPRSRFTEDTADRRCQVCRHLCFLSMVVHESDNVVFCLECALRYIQKRRTPRGLKMMFRYSEEQINSLVSRVCGRVLERAGAKQKAICSNRTPAKLRPRNKSSASSSARS